MYIYSDLMRDMRTLSAVAETGCAGLSVLSREIPFVRMGRGRRVLVHGGIHAREWVTAYLVILMAKAAVEIKPGLDICFIPCANPDGCEIAQMGSCDARLTGINGGSDDFSMWKANANAVDINVNFDAGWGSGAANVTHPAPESYIGPYAGSEPETQALMRMTEIFRPELTISYHALGREVYWEFGQEGERRLSDRSAAAKIADALGYTLVDGCLGSAGGYKDWCVQKGITAVTVEIIGSARCHPLCEGDLAPDIKRNIDLLRIL